MPYTYQTFTSGQVFTGAQAQQIEDNIRDHRHGLAGVGVVGLGYNVSSKGGAFSVAAADHGTLFLAGGDFDISMAAAGTLGATFGCGIKNIGSGRIAIKPNGSQLIDASSYFVLTPGEMTNLYSDGIGLGTFGNSYGPKLLFDFNIPASWQNIDITRLYPGDFASYKLTGSQLYNGTATKIAIRVSQDSGSSFISAGYTDEGTVETTFTRWSFSSVGSLQFQFGDCTFANLPHAANFGVTGITRSFEWSAGAQSNTYGRGFKWPVTSILNALRVFPVDYFTAGRIQLWGYPRR